MTTLICELDRAFIRTSLKTELRINRIKGLLTRIFVTGQSATGHETDYSSTDLLLPVNEEVIDFLSKRKREGCTLLLRSESDKAQICKLLPQHDVFDDIIDHGSAADKALMSAPFEYLGTSATPLDIWQKAEKRHVAEGANQSVTGYLSKHNLPVEHRFHNNTRPTLQTLLSAVRAHQWLKNILVFVPLIASQQMLSAEPLLKSVAMFLCFSMVASFGYIINDILDIQSDRAHLEKKHRPLASGDLPLAHALTLAVLLLACATSASLLLSTTATLVLLAYLALTLAYSAFLKTKLMLDVVTLGAAFTLRVIGGAAAIESEISFYLLSFSIFLFASLGMLKRYAELLSLKTQNKLSAKGRGYQVEDMAPVRIIGISMGTMSVFVLGQYINSPLVAEYYKYPTLIWLLLPLLLYWLGRLWLLTNRGEVKEDPLLFAVKDRASQLTFVTSVLILVLAD